MMPDKTLILYDGECGLCNTSVQFLIRHDKHDRFRFASLQSAIGRSIVQRNGGDPDKLSTVYLVENAQQEKETVRTRAKAVLYAIDRIGGAWRIIGTLRVLPAFLLNPGYALIAHFRYRIWGKLDSCTIPSPAHSHKFIS